jgi:hypothetical protein
MKLLTALATVLLLGSPAFAATPYRMENVMLLQPDFVLKERAPSVESLSQYIKAVQGAAEKALSGEHPHPAGGYLVLAVRPGGQSMVWLDFKPHLPELIATKLRKAILEVPAFDARGGVVVFALNSSLWEAPASQSFPNPEEWSAAMEGRSEPMEIGDLVDMVWSSRAGT